MVMKILIIIFVFFKMEENEITKGHNFRLVKEKIDWIIIIIIYYYLLKPPLPKNKIQYNVHT